MIAYYIFVQYYHLVLLRCQASIPTSFLSLHSPVFACVVIFQQLGLERELIKVQANLEAEMNMRNQANSAKADMESKS